MIIWKRCQEYWEPKDTFINCSNSFWLILFIFSHLFVSFHMYLRLLSFSQMELLLVTLPCHALSHRATPCFITCVTTTSPHAAMSPQVATMSWHGTGGSCWRSSVGAEQQKPGDPSRSVTEKARSSLENRCKTANTHGLICTRYSYMLFLLFFYVFDLCIFCVFFATHLFMFYTFILSCLLCPLHILQSFAQSSAVPRIKTSTGNGEPAEDCSGRHSASAAED